MLSLSALLLLAAPAAAPAPKVVLAPPTVVMAAGEPIDVGIGHAAPFVGDLLGVGKPQLLVGQFGDGKLRVYRDAGKAPRFDKFENFQAGSGEGKVPTG